jgi:hypothetical protein
LKEKDEIKPAHVEKKEEDKHEPPKERPKFTGSLNKILV